MSLGAWLAVFDLPCIIIVSFTPSAAEGVHNNNIVQLLLGKPIVLRQV